jgi:hypothetical protein
MSLLDIIALQQEDPKEEKNYLVRDPNPYTAIPAAGGRDKNVNMKSMRMRVMDVLYDD